MTAIPLSAEDEAAAQLIVGRIIGRTKLQEEPMVPASVVRRQLAAVGQDMIAMQKKIASLRAALEPLAQVGEAIDESPFWAQMMRPDNATIWQANGMQRRARLTMGHARAARKALEEE